MTGGAPDAPGARVVEILDPERLLAPGSIGVLADDVDPIPVRVADGDPAARNAVAVLLVDLGFAPVDVGRRCHSVSERS